jgi:hypothetical protein
MNPSSNPDDCYEDYEVFDDDDNVDDDDGLEENPEDLDDLEEENGIGV